MKVCLHTDDYPPDVGGVAVAAQRLARILVAAGYAVHVITVLKDPAAPPGLVTRDEAGVTVHRLRHADGGHNAPFAMRALVRGLDEAHRFDLFHGFFLTAVHPCIAAVKASGRPRPVIASIRGSDVMVLKDHPFTRAGILAGLQRATWVTSVSDAHLDYAAHDVDLAGRSSVIRNAVAPIAEAAQGWALGAHNRGRVGLVGKIRKIKDAPLLVRGYAGVPPALRRELLIAGAFYDPDEEAWCQTLIGDFGIAGQVQITGNFAQPQVFDHLRAMHVYVQCSAQEGLPNALLEAASLGLPLVATAVGGMAEVIEHGVSGLLVPHGDPGALSAAISRILADDGLASRLSAGARAMVAGLSPERERDDWLGLYRRLLGPG